MISCWLLRFRDFGRGYSWCAQRNSCCKLIAGQQTNDLLNEILFGASSSHLPLTFMRYILETKTKAQNFPEYQVQQQNTIHLDTGGHFLDFTGDTSASDFHHCTSHQSTTASYTCENNSPKGQTLILLSWNCKASWQTPDHATFSTHHLQKWHCQRRHWRIWGCWCK